MLADLPPLIGQMGWGGVVLLAVLMIFRGKLVPERYYLDAIKRAEAAEAASENYRKAGETLLRQNGELITNADLTLAMLNSIKGYAAAKDGDDP